MLKNGMAIFKAGTPNPTGTVNQGTLYTQTAGRAAALQQANNNRNSKSAAFQNLNNVIIQLDKNYDLLADKSPWVTYAANILGDWQLCANCQPDYGAKKLYRQYNFNRMILGLAPVSAPAFTTVYCESDDILCAYSQSTATYSLTSMSTSGSVTTTAQLGRALGNPSTLLPETYNYPDPIPAGLLGLIQAVQAAPARTEVIFGTVYLEADCCNTDPNGAPGKKSVCVIRLDP